MAFYVIVGIVLAYALLALDVRWANASHVQPVPKSVELAWAFCAVAYACNLLANFLKLVFMRRSTRKIHILGLYISFLASSTYFFHWMQWATHEVDMKSLLFMPSRWVLYALTMPAIWWILAYISDYTLRRKLYVLWLNAVMIVAGGIATTPWLSWGHKVFWMALSCVPFPELCFHLWQMVSDAIATFPLTERPSSLIFIRIFGQFCYQFFPAIYFAAFDGCIPLALSEPLWAMCDWSFKMVMSSSLMEANFYTTAQRREYALYLMEQAQSFHTMKQLTLAVERKDSFLSSMSHELRTPLNGILGMAEAASSVSKGKFAPAVQNTINVIKLSGRRLLQLINDILDVAQIRKGVLLIRHEEVQIQELIDDIIDLMIPLRPTGVRVFKKVAPLPTITADGRRVAQILFNLLGNALKFTSVGYVRVMAGFSAAKGMVFVAVRDTGCGIRVQDMQKMFTVFEQGDMTTTRTHGGTGLGLHLVLELVKAHRGEICIKTRLNEGSLFVVWLPLSQPKDDDADEADLKSGSVGLTVSDTELDEPEFDDESVVDEEVRPRLVDPTVVLPSAVTNSIDPFGANSSASRSSYMPLLAPPRQDPRASTESAARPTDDSNDLAQPRESLERAAFDSNVRRMLNARSSFDLGEPEAARERSDVSVRSVLDVMRTLSQDAADSERGHGGSWHSREKLMLFHSEVYGKHLILTVDDDPVNQMVFSNVLKPLGYKLRQPMDGNAALLDLKQYGTLPDVILLDCMMPGLSGYDVCREVRRVYGYAIPVIMVSANASPTQVLLGLEEGANDYIKKPFHRDELNVRIHAHLRTSRLCTYELEARSPVALLHLNLPSTLHDDILSGLSVATEAAAPSVVLHARFHHARVSTLELDDQRFCGTMKVLTEVLRAASTRFGVIVVAMSASAVVCVPNPEAIAADARQEHMVLFAAHVMTTLTDVLHTQRSDLQPSIALVAGRISFSVLSTFELLPRFVVMGAAVAEARALAGVVPPGLVYTSGIDLETHAVCEGYTSAPLNVRVRGSAVDVIAMSSLSAASAVPVTHRASIAPPYITHAKLSRVMEEFKEVVALWTMLNNTRQGDAQAKDVRLWEQINEIKRSIIAYSSMPIWTSNSPALDDDAVFAAASKHPRGLMAAVPAADAAASPNEPSSVDSYGPPIEVLPAAPSNAHDDNAHGAAAAAGDAAAPAALRSALDQIKARGGGPRRQQAPAAAAKVGADAGALGALRHDSPITDFCRCVNAAEHIPRFQEALVSIRDVAGMTESQLAAFGVAKMGDRLRMIISARKVLAAADPPSTAAARLSPR